MSESLKLRIARIINATAFDDSMNLPVELRASWQRGAKEKALEILKAIEEPTQAMIEASMDMGQVPICDGEARARWETMIHTAQQED